MTTIAKSDAADRFAELLERIAKGETFEITEDGHPIGRLLPAVAPQSNQSSTGNRAAEHLISLSATFKKMAASEVANMIHEGHRF